MLVLLNENLIVRKLLKYYVEFWILNIFTKLSIIHSTRICSQLR